MFKRGRAGIPGGGVRPRDTSETLEGGPVFGLERCRRGGTSGVVILVLRGGVLSLATMHPDEDSRGRRARSPTTPLEVIAAVLIPVLRGTGGVNWDLDLEDDLIRAASTGFVGGGVLSLTTILGRRAGTFSTGTITGIRCC